MLGFVARWAKPPYLQGFRVVVMVTVNTSVHAAILTSRGAGKPTCADCVSYLGMCIFDSHLSSLALQRGHSFGAGVRGSHTWVWPSLHLCSI